MNNLSWIKDFLDIVAQQGKFPVGLVVGIAVGMAAMYLSDRINSKDRRETRKIDLDREKALLSQLQEKDSRISKLHDQMARLQKELKKPGE